MEDVGRRRRLGLGSGFFYFLSYKSSKCNENQSFLHYSQPVYMNFHNNIHIVGVLARCLCVARKIKIFGRKG